jgi:hypothetical protein
MQTVLRPLTPYQRQQNVLDFLSDVGAGQAFSREEAPWSRERLLEQISRTFDECGLFALGPNASHLAWITGWDPRDISRLAERVISGKKYVRRLQNESRWLIFVSRKILDRSLPGTEPPAAATTPASWK